LNGVTYQFSTAENLQRFKINPTKFAPWCGGYGASLYAQFIKQSLASSRSLVSKPSVNQL
jgi:hypothetical protein